jgi:hippurate hydrolase
MSHSIFDQVRAFHPELTAIRRDLHAHPELGLEEVRTAAIVADRLREWGIEVHTGIGVTGVVGVLRHGNGHGRIGLRADMDALPMPEASGLPHASTVPGKMHACGHDGHTTMLLGAAKYLAETRNFDGTVHFIFQPAEEGLGGAKAMLADGLFERFPCDAVYGMHNWPGLPTGRFATSRGARMAGGGFFEITIEGRGAHGAMPHQSVDPVMIAFQLGSAIQSIVSRNIAARESAVVSITRLSAGDAFNVIPQRVTMGGTARAFTREVLSVIETNMRRLTEEMCAGLGAKGSLKFDLLFAPTVNDDQEAAVISDAAADVAGENNVDRNWPPVSGSEDFSFMMEAVPGAHIFVGNGEASAAVHNDQYDFNDDVIPYGVALYGRIVERKLPRGASE